MSRLCDTVRFVVPDGRTIVITPRRQARGLVLRRKKNELWLTVPYGYDADELMRRLPGLIERFDAKYPADSRPMYSVGTLIRCCDVEIEIYEQNVHPRHVLIGQGVPRSRLGVGSEIDLKDPSAQRFLSDVLCKLAFRLAPDLILPLAENVARRVGMRPHGWRIGRGLRTLGTCSAQKVVTLSCALVFLPSELREYVICHELAHLTEMNHSARFHALCNSYLNGQEKPLTAALRRYEWPIMR